MRLLGSGLDAYRGMGHHNRAGQSSMRLRRNTKSGDAESSFISCSSLLNRSHVAVTTARTRLPRANVSAWSDDGCCAVSQQ